ncbi:26S protease regulatory subunit 4 [Tolypocladium paradoxum]|uniref:26S protease regulatory subunit 4 n=1 Tax=Tolypocladium paradoxum TaxID=94208 RepID=A0A2S4KUA4_9HYPO|nr:26S protease regulatory subunit 4 [Tolypocladium paradoxum]
MSDNLDPARKSDDESVSVVVVTPAEPATENGEGQAAEKGKSRGDKPEKPKEKQVVGIVPESKDLYAKYDEQKKRSWTEKKPYDFEEAAENEDTEKYAVIVRKEKPQDADSSRPLVIHSLIIQSPYLKRVLADVLHGYPGILTNLSRLKLTAPFECFVHRWDRFEAARNDPSLEDAAKEHLELLHGIMLEDLGDVITLRGDYLKNKAVSFDHVWTLFPPGCTVFGQKNDKPVAAKFQDGYYGKTSCGNIYALNCRIVDWNGTTMGWTDLELRIPEFLGTKPFSSLPCYPLDYHPQVDAVTAMLQARGRQFESLAGYCYRSYKGVALWHPEAKTRRENVQSRIVVDGANWEKENWYHQVKITPFHKEGEARGWRGSCSDDGECDDEYAEYDEEYDGGADDDGSERAPLTEEQLLMATPMVRGYALQNKRWMEFYIDDISDVQFNEGAFSSLVMPEEKKELILAFAQSQVKYKSAFDDVISGKGKGIIMLLSGGPGIGKTLTAESVAEEMRVPLYTMSAGDLGSEAYRVGANLGKILAMVADWNAVLLLDECDVFLEERTPQNMERNRIVATFLRTLEYYEGILFLTTNRVENMDPAFQSRIHVSLEYPPLDAEARAAVWRSFLGRTVSLEDTAVRGDAAHGVTEDEVRALSALDLNGRVIKNVLKTANLLACHRRETLAFGHVRTVLQIGGHSL